MSVRHGQCLPSRDYHDNSMMQFDPQFDVIGPIKVSRSQYFPQQSTRASLLFNEAVQAAC